MVTTSWGAGTSSSSTALMSDFYSERWTDKMLSFTDDLKSEKKKKKITPKKKEKPLSFDPEELYL